MPEPYSCLREDQSGLDSPAALEEDEVLESLQYGASDLGLEVMEGTPAEDAELADGEAAPSGILLPEDFERPLGMAERRTEDRMGVAAPAWAGIYQCRAATRLRRTPANIFYVIWHTPEGGEAGTLSVLKGTRAGYDVFVPRSGRAYKCNDWWNYVAWQAGDWGYNRASIGIEQGDYAASSGSWPESFYDRLAFVCAWMGEVCNIAIRNGARGVPGYIDHAEITPGARSDPGANYRRELMLQKISDLRHGRTEPIEPAKPGRAERIFVVYAEGGRAEPFVRACVEALRDAGFPKDRIGAYHEPRDVRWASYKARHGRLGQFICIVAGEEPLLILHPEARNALADSRGKWYPPDVSDLWDCTTDVHRKLRWRIDTICKRHDLNSAKALDLYEQKLEGKAPAR